MTATGKNVYEETAEDWSAEFLEDGGWRVRGGHTQSMLFAYHASKALLEANILPNKWEKEGDFLSLDVFTLHDYGCACGDGTAFLQMLFPGAQVKGFDFAPEGIEVAKKRWPYIDFEVGNIETPQEFADVIWTSHTLEHLKDPSVAINELLTWCRLLVAIVPLITETENGEHDGAMPTTEWLAKCPKVAWKTAYDTLRKNMHTDEFMLEGNLLLVWNRACLS